MVDVRLSRAEATHGAFVGVRRRTNAIGWKTTDYVGGGLDPWGRDIEAACAEIALAKALDIFYDFSQGRYAGMGADVGGWQVRWTERVDGRLILRPRDPDGEPYMLVVGSVPAFRIVGWMHGEDAKVDAYRQDPGGRGLACWMVPQADLREPQREPPVAVA